MGLRFQTNSEGYTGTGPNTYRPRSDTRYNSEHASRASYEYVNVRKSKTWHLKQMGPCSDAYHYHTTTMLSALFKQAVDVYTTTTTTTVLLYLRTALLLLLLLLLLYTFFVLQRVSATTLGALVRSHYYCIWYTNRYFIISRKLLQHTILVPPHRTAVPSETSEVHTVRYTYDLKLSPGNR